MLSFEKKSCLKKRWYTVAPRKARQPGHTVMRTASHRGGGTGRPSSSMDKTYPSMASRIFPIAASLVSPRLIHPGRLGHSATQKPSSPD